MQRALVLCLATILAALVPSSASAGDEYGPGSTTLVAVFDSCELHGRAARSVDHPVHAGKMEGSCVGLVNPACPAICGAVVPYVICRFAGFPETGMSGRCGEDRRAFAIGPTESPSGGATWIRFGSLEGTAVVVYR